MGRPRMIIIVRHAQSEGNRNRSIHQTVPDHRVKLTPEGQQQAEQAGSRLRELLRPDDTLQIYTSPYRRTRETTEGMLRSLTADTPGPSPFPRHTVRVFEEPRLREQDFGNFQPCSAAMERMWRERADYGHFFYRIPHGESAADAYDRVSGFNETLWRSFSDPDFPSVCVLVTHGLMARVFLMRWFHWTVEYFEDLRNINHCEFVVMQRGAGQRKYTLLNTLRTWSDLKRRDAPAAAPAAAETDNATATQWGGCPDGCDHDHDADPPEAAPAAPRVQTPPRERDTDAVDVHDESPSQLREPDWLRQGRDFGGSRSGFTTPAAGLADGEPDYGFPSAGRGGGSSASPVRRRRADALGDQTDEDDEQEEEEEEEERGVRASVY